MPGSMTEEVPVFAASGRLRLIWALTCASSAVAGVDASCTFLFAPTFNVYLTETPCLR